MGRAECQRVWRLRERAARRARMSLRDGTQGAHAAQRGMRLRADCQLGERGVSGNAPLAGGSGTAQGTRLGEHAAQGTRRSQAAQGRLRERGSGSMRLRERGWAEPNVRECGGSGNAPLAGHACRSGTALRAPHCTLVGAGVVTCRPRFSMDINGIPFRPRKGRHRRVGVQAVMLSRV